MGIRVSEWRQGVWTRAGRAFWEREGDFWNASGLYPDAMRQRLLRAPGWSSVTAWPAGFGRPEGAFYDRPNAGFSFVGLDPGDDHVAIASYTETWALDAVVDLGTASATYGALSGLSQRNCVFWGSLLYFISGSYALYVANPTTPPMTLLWSGSGGESAQLLCPYADQLFLITNGGRVLRLNAAGTGFEAYHTPRVGLDVRYACAFHQYVLLVSRTQGGQLALLRLPDVNPVILHEPGRLEVACGNEAAASPFTDGCPFAVHDNALYFTSGYYAQSGVVDVYRFDGHNVERVSQLVDLPTLAETRSAGLLVWRGELLYFTVHRTSGAHVLRMRVGDGWVDFCPASFTASDYSCFYSLAGALCSPARSGSTEGFVHTSGRQNGYVETARLHLHQPGRLKRLDRLAALVSGAHAGFTVTLKYRADDAADWVTAGSGSNARRVSAEVRGVEFYTLQVRVEVADSSGGELDYALEDVSVVYSVDAPG